MIDISRVGNNLLAIAILLFFFILIVSKYTKKPVGEMMQEFISIFRKNEDNYDEPRGFNK